MVGGREHLMGILQIRSAARRSYYQASPSDVSQEHLVRDFIRDLEKCDDVALLDLWDFIECEMERRLFARHSGFDSHGNPKSDILTGCQTSLDSRTGK